METFLISIPMNITENITGKNILLIGGGSGMGEATALALANKGAKVAITGRRIETLNKTASQADKAGSILCKVSDVTDRESLNALFEWFDRHVGKLDYLVHAAGINVAMRSMQELAPE